MTRLSLTVAERAGGPHIVDLTTIRGTPTVTWRVDGPPTATFAINARDHDMRRIVDGQAGGVLDPHVYVESPNPEADAIDELTVDLIAEVDGAPLFRGLIAPATDSFDATSHHVDYVALGYADLLDTRFLHDDDTLIFNQVGQFDIAWTLISEAQSRTNGSLGITLGATTGLNTLRDRLDGYYEVGKPVGEAVTQLGEVIGGFDWEVDGLLRFNAWSPQRGVDRDFTFDFPGIVRTGSRRVGADRYGNAVGQQGDTNADTPLAVEYREAANLAAAPEGRWERFYSDSSLQQQATVADRAMWNLDRAADLRAGYEFTIDAEAWGGPDALWLGDTAGVVVHSGHRNIDTRLRVTEIRYQGGPDGRDTVAFTVGHMPPNTLSKVRRVLSRVSTLERR